MGPTATLSYVFQHAALILGRQSDQVLQERLGIGMAQFRILMMLQSTPNVQQRRIADRLGQTEASISRQIKLLLQKGMLATEINPKNRREHLLLITAKGIKITQAAQEVLEQYQEQIWERFNPKERQQLTDMLSSIHATICHPNKPFACDRPFNI